jgi:hypothetical protein
MKMEVAAMRIGREINQLEQDLDTALSRAGVLMAEMASASRKTGVPAVESQRAFARAAAAVGKLVDARGDIVRSHEDLRRIAESADVLEKCPPTTGFLEPVNEERIAA